MLSGVRARARQTRLRATLPCVVALALTAAGPAHAATAAPAAPVFTSLSNIHSVSRWAYTAAATQVRARPSAHARTVGRLRFFTIDGQAELYATLDSAQLASGATWLKIEVPGRPNGRTGWVPQTALGPLHEVDGYLHVDKRALRVTYFRDGKSVFSAPVGVGKASTITPSGHFYVMEKLRTLNAPLYGPYALGTSAYAPTLSEWPGGGVVGIHGTNEPGLIPGRPSHGCVRMLDADIARLWHMVGLGTPIDITD